MKPWVLIDISYLAHRARYAIADLQYEDLYTGIIFGFWEQLRVICADEHIQSNKIALFFDSKKSFRRQIFPDYKRHRKDDRTPDEIEQLEVMYEQIGLLRREILPAIGFSIYRQTGCESDDLMAAAAEKMFESREKGIIVTADGDLWQCINDYISWYDPARKNLYDSYSFWKQKGIEPVRWGLVKALAGCSGDGVPGIPGVGEKTAIKYLERQLPTHYKTHKAITSPEGINIFNRNKDLVILPHLKTKPINLQEPEYNTEAFFEMCKRYGFLTYLKEPKKNEWEAFFNNTQVKTRKRGELI